jgi:hypothetical protein
MLTYSGWCGCCALLLHAIVMQDGDVVEFRHS